MSEAPASGALEGSAFPLPVKLLATALVCSMLLWGGRTLPELAQVQWSVSSIVVFGLAVVMVLWCLYWIWRSRTRVDTHGVAQTWLWDKQVAWTDVAQARIVGVPGMEWLFAPRLVLRVRGRGAVMFHAADPAVLRALALFVTTGSVPAQLIPEA
ncbi:MAG TPA: hypothetical protein VFH35_12185 [Ramlibacter sp.]|nr:hypothetical protein [Ramlibacter sp.]